jgi:threonyl-tRNA synthetase
MKPITVTLPDGSQRSVPEGSTPWDVVKSIGKRLEQDAVAAKIDGKVVDLTRKLDRDCQLAIVTRSTPEGLEVLRHSTAHLLAQAIKELFPAAQITIGPVIEDGFYYDIDYKEKLVPEDLPRLEKKMTEIASRNLDVTRDEWDKTKAVSFFRDIKEEFKAEIIQSIPDTKVSVYTQGDFTDLCRGPHVPNTARLGKFKLLSIAGAYWRGDEKNPMLQRIYGTAWATQKELDEYLFRIEEAKKRDHRKLGPELGLFTFLTEIAPAMPFYLPKGALLYNSLVEFMRKEIAKQGYQEVICPQLMTSVLWQKSGHLQNYSENMFLFKDGDSVSALKPMNCPGHAALFGSTKHSYRDLPLRYAEFSKLHRNERAGVTHGLMRTRTFAQDDAHIFCTEDQIQEESKVFIEHTLSVYKKFAFTDIVLKLATRPEKRMGSDESWDKSEKALETALTQLGLKFDFLKGEGAFYGPKIEFHIKDSIGRYWQCGTIQVDYNMPERFELEYIDKDNQPRRPVMLHRAEFGSLERFMGILIEHTAGHIPLWIAPLQAAIINVTADQEAYAKSWADRLAAQGLRVELDARNEKLGYRIREAQVKKVPLMLVIGAKEVESQTVSVRKRTGETVDGLNFEAFLEFFHKESNNQEK